MKNLLTVFLIIPTNVQAWMNHQHIHHSYWPRASYAQLSDDQEVELLKEKAAQLREEIASFEQSKAKSVEMERQEQAKAQAEATAKRERYSAILPILKPDGNTIDERCDFPPFWTEDGSSFITVMQSKLPLGILLGESEEIPGAIVVDEVAKGSNGEQAGVQVGDLVRACTACRMEMVQPTWQLIVGGIGQPKTVRFMYSIENNKPFDEVMEAIGSNRMDPDQRPVILVVERKETIESLGN